MLFFIVKILKSINLYNLKKIKKRYSLLKRKYIFFILNRLILYSFIMIHILKYYSILFTTNLAWNHLNEVMLLK